MLTVQYFYENKPHVRPQKRRVPQLQTTIYVRRGGGIVRNKIGNQNIESAWLAIKTGQHFI